MQYIEELKKRMGMKLSSHQYDSLVAFMSILSYNTVIKIPKFTKHFAINSDLAEEVLNVLVEIGKLKKDSVIRCPKCDFCLDTVADIENMDDKMYCYACNNDIEVSTDDVDVIFMLCRDYKNHD
jgi:hypothetical protein